MKRMQQFSVLFTASLAVAGCSGNGNATSGGANFAPPAPGITDSAVVRPEAATSVLKLLTKQATVGSVVDPVNGANNPYGLTVAPVTSGDFKAGDLVICNFNAKSGVEGSGESIVAIHPEIGSKPRHVSSDKTLLGCDALALDSGDGIWAASQVANDNPIISPTGALLLNIKAPALQQPWGQAYAAPANGAPVFYESNATDGTIVRINLSGTTFDVIAKGFPVNHGKPGTALAPSGLSYDAHSDTLYFVDGENNTVVALRDVATIPTNGVVAENDGKTFSGPSASKARIVYSGKPLNGPISAALLPNGNLVVGNTLDPNGKNLMIELAPSGKLLDVRNVDPGAAGAIFGMVVTGTNDDNTKIYFNDDNTNTLQVIEK